MDDATPEPRRCRICGYPLDGKNRTGLCSNRTPACRKAREQLTAEQKPGKFRVTIKAGDTFGLWTALEDYDRTSLTVLCRCKCGIERRIPGAALTNGHTTACRSCGQKNRRKPAREPYLKAGSVFGRLTLLEDVTYAHARGRWRCECNTKAEVEIEASSVRFGHTRSCGCLFREANTKHGLSKHPLYQIWKGILARCINPNGQSYEDYGARGVTICDQWCDDVAVFVADIEREIGPRPEGKRESGRAVYEIDRIDNDGNYEPGNIRWATRPEQMQNRRKVPKLTRDVLRLTRELDAATAELATLKASRPSRRDRGAAEAAPDITLF